MARAAERLPRGLALWLPAAPLTLTLHCVVAVQVTLIPRGQAKGLTWFIPGAPGGADLGCAVGLEVGQGLIAGFCLLPPCAPLLGPHLLTHPFP